jgi:hypothetical protein
MALPMVSLKLRIWAVIVPRVLLCTELKVIKRTIEMLARSKLNEQSSQFVVQNSPFESLKVRTKERTTLNGRQKRAASMANLPRDQNCQFFQASLYICLTSFRRYFLFVTPRKKSDVSQAFSLVSSKSRRKSAPNTSIKE